jgi:hypothetical protein
MPLIYKASCAKCSYSYLASDRSLAVQLDDGTVIDLRHPGEFDDLAKLGFTSQQVDREARLVRCSHFICRQCGGPYVRRVFAEPTGCLGAVLMLAAIPLMLWLACGLLILAHRQAPQHAIVAAAALALTFALYRWSNRSYRHHLPLRPKLADQRCCATATANHLVRIDRCWRVRFPCPACKERESVTVTRWGIS